MYEQGYADFWNFCDPQEDNSEYNIGWADAMVEFDLGEYEEGWGAARDGLEMGTNAETRRQMYREDYNKLQESATSYRSLTTKEH